MEKMANKETNKITMNMKNQEKMERMVKQEHKEIMELML